jgi:hypothetical protein
MPPQSENDTSSLERARKRLYSPVDIPRARPTLARSGKREMQHAWEEDAVKPIPHQGERRVHLAGVFFIVAVIFFIGALAVAGYFFYFGGNVVSVDKITIDIQGPSTIAGGDTVSFSLSITNKNPTAIHDATIEIDFPSGTRDATNVLTAYPHYIEDLGTIESGATVTRTVKAVIFGGVGQSLMLPVSFSYGAVGSNAVFVKKSSYTLAVSTTPLQVTVDTLSDTVSNKPLTLTITVRSNAIVPLNNVVVVGSFPFGFLPTSSSLPLNNSSFLLGTLAPGASKTITLTGTLTGQNKEQRVFHFTVGTADTANNQTLAVTYMTEDATVTIEAPFIDTTLAINGDTSANAVITSGSNQSVTISYSNTLATTIGNATVAIMLSGSAIDFNSIRTSSGFYNSIDHSIIFSRDTDPSLASLAPGASGVGTFSFSTLPAVTLQSSPTVTFTISVSGTRVGQTNVAEVVNSSVTRTFKLSTVVALSASSLHTSGPFGNIGPIPPKADQPTTYTIVWGTQNRGSAVAGGTVTATLPTYVTYTNQTTGTGTVSYDEKSRTVTWDMGDLSQGANAQAAFQVSVTPSSSQNGSAPPLTSAASFSGFDRFAGVQISATADPVTTETPQDPGYTASSGAVQ